MATTTASGQITNRATRDRLNSVYESLFLAYGPQHWWPANSPYEVCIGAILTQSTSWQNVEKAIGNLKSANILSHEGIRKARTDRLARLIRPSLYYNVKARKLKEFTKYLEREYEGRVDAMTHIPMQAIRQELLAVWGLGPETVDSIILYALNKPSFVVDAYTKRIFERLGLVDDKASYDDVKALFEDALPKDARLFNEYHALIVQHAKSFCRTKPMCESCCLSRDCIYGYR
jgi:endonuclease-3 related protein